MNKKDESSNEQESFELDCAIVRAKKSKEMHNWFVVSRNYSMSTEKLESRYNKITNNIQYMKKIHKYNKKLREEEIKHLSIRKEILRKIISNGGELDAFEKTILGMELNPYEF